MLAQDHADSLGMSVQGILGSWFGLSKLKDLILALGAMVLLLPLLKIKQYSSPEFRFRMLAFLLLWIVIFNHKAESPTYIIAVAGVGLWFFALAKGKIETFLVILVFIGTSLIVTDFCPAYIRKTFVFPYFLKALPCILVWFWIGIKFFIKSKNETKDVKLNN
jgi:hypothetical protein